ncbi:N-acetylneuraminate synthase [Candidatus Campbellbacteria bacterium CG22_combo_CG10-13_8_21_14_all_36_13]|uniref:N-acetylneuraminate synthase n=1 Tax=Candidatus Campbellbacteria bacterium CG22_combo_CG10-13_8_21_14_all_36_13 TaxID=1974529 RepID=A0A2H0DY55_9BACT|nr:MAG: N-acetylneuraminate synthase [Candidatus Campbellbacteria bacterium CG22_combo_CG10-13_8_21_14_all_36_13]
MSNVAVGDRVVGDNSPCFVVAEIGINHNGDINIAKQLIQMAHEAGCDAVKFQKRTVELCYTPEELAVPRESPWGKTNGDQKRGLEFGLDEYIEIDHYCRELGIMWFASPWDKPSVDFLERFNPPCYKVASARVRGEDEFLHYLRQTGRPIVVSTGACEEEHILHVVDVLGRKNLIITHCVLQYPCESVDLNLRVITTLKDLFPDVPIGYSGHEKGVATSVMAVVLGAVLVERHITLDRTMYGSDQPASLERGGVEQLVRDIRVWERARGDGVNLILPAEEANWQKLRRKL